MIIIIFRDPVGQWGPIILSHPFTDIIQSKRSSYIHHIVTDNMIGLLYHLTKFLVLIRGLSSDWIQDQCKNEKTIFVF